MRAPLGNNTQLRKLASKMDEQFATRATIISFSPETPSFEIIRLHPDRWSSGQGNE
jgi:hypothetical protein